MNSQLEKFARDTLKEGLAELTEANHLIFKRMYSPDDLTLDINEVVDSMPSNRLDWAMQQVERSIRPNHCKDCQPDFNREACEACSYRPDPDPDSITCSHKSVTVYDRLVSLQTLYEPAEYEFKVTCDECDEEFNEIPEGSDSSEERWEEEFDET